MDASQFAAPRALAHVQRAFELREGFARFGEESFARSGQRDRTLRATKQLHAQHVLHFLDLHGKRGRRDAECVRGLCEMQPLGDSDEVTQMSELHGADWVLGRT